MAVSGRNQRPEDRGQKLEDRRQGPEGSRQEGMLLRFSLWAVPQLFRLLCFCLFATCRVQRRGSEYFDGFARAGTPFIVSFWHYGIIYIVHHGRRGVPCVAMVSASRDGEYVSRILQSKGFSTVRGSRNRGAVSALKGLMKEMAAGRTAALIADGSQGPARKAQAGTILLAARTGAPILPMGWAADRYRTFRSWDRTAIPLPFARIVMWYGEPFTVPRELKEGELEQYRLRLEQALNELYAKSWREFGREGH